MCAQQGFETPFEVSEPPYGRYGHRCAALVRSGLADKFVVLRLGRSVAVFGRQALKSLNCGIDSAAFHTMTASG